MNDRFSPDRLMSALLSPASVALVGASDDPGKTAGRPQQFLRRAGFQGRIYPINAKRTLVQDAPAWPSLEALPEVPDHVFVMTPTDTVLEVVGQCVMLGVPLVTVLASGFSESGPEGVAREEALRALVAGSRTRLLGPSSLGVVRASTGLMLTANAAFAEPDVPVGRLFVASHSGSMLGALVSRGKARGVGFAGMVSVGSEVDLSIGEICQATLDDPSIDGYLLFIESLRHGAKLQAFAREAARRGKPVIAYKLGRSSAAAEMAATHTGAIAGEDDVADAFLKDLGIARVDQFETLLETLPLARRFPLPPPGTPRRPLRVGVVTTTGGGSAMVVDQLGVRGIDVTHATPATLARLAAAGVATNPGRVLDLTLAGTRYDVMKATLDILLDAPEFDLVVSVVGSSARFQPDLAVQPLLDHASHKRPLAAMLVPDAPGALAKLTSAGIPCFRSPETCADAIAAIAARRPLGTPAATQKASATPPRPISEAEAYGVLDALGVPHAPAATIRLSAPPAPLPFGFPVVAKVCSAEIPHKTEVGGVVLGISNQEELAAALLTLKQNLAQHAPGIACDEALIQPMVKGLAEVLVGYRVDPEAGPIVMLAAGGIWAEVAKDRSIRLAPVSIETAREMVDEVRSLASVRGLRGKPRGDLEALAAAVSALSELAMQPDTGISEAEVNPLLVMPEGQGVLAVDALVLKLTRP
ncbi:acetate--CoA ligase family protein [Ottowia thiooxydans]|uniref:acetate--CoA ligase family protein n=1 Tax=Ottowia thiooxydans TaxID=219182 RepID=UPI0004296029|nr:acetate--CoA ligase family protein [Ottowia thiooxydans]